MWTIKGIKIWLKHNFMVKDIHKKPKRQLTLQELKKIAKNRKRK